MSESAVAQLVSPVRGRRSDGRLIAVLAVAITPYSLLQSMTVPAIPRIQAEYGANQATAAWLLTGFLLASTIATPVLGRVGDSFGKKRVMLLALLLLLLGAVMAAVAPSMEWMIASRILQGVSGGVMPLAFGVIRDEASPGRVAPGISLLAGWLAGGFAAGIVIAGPIVDSFGVHWIFTLGAIGTALAIVAVAVFVPPSAEVSRQPIPIAPALLLAAWLATLVFAVTGGPEHGWTSAFVIANLTAAVALFVFWAVVELRIEIPLIDLRLMSRRGVWTANLVSLLVGMALYGTHGFVPQFSQTPLENGYGFAMGVTGAGHMMLPAAVSTFICGLIASRLADRWGVRWVVLVGGALAAAALVLVALLHSSIPLMYLWVGLSGLGTGLVFASVPNVIVASVPRDQTGVATGVNTNLRALGGTLGTALCATLLDAAEGPTGYASLWGYQAAFLMLAVASVLAAIVALAIPRRRVRVNAGIDESAPIR